MVDPVTLANIEINKRRDDAKQGRGNAPVEHRIANALEGMRDEMRLIRAHLELLSSKMG